jgi:hypothetical protein
MPLYNTSSVNRFVHLSDNLNYVIFIYASLSFPQFFLSFHTISGLFMYMKNLNFAYPKVNKFRGKGGIK